MRECRGRYSHAGQQVLRKLFCFAIARRRARRKVGLPQYGKQRGAQRNRTLVAMYKARLHLGMHLSGDVMMMRALKNNHRRGDVEHEHESPPSILPETLLRELSFVPLR